MQEESSNSRNLIIAAVAAAVVLGLAVFLGVKFLGPTPIVATKEGEAIGATPTKPGAQPTPVAKLPANIPGGPNGDAAYYMKNYGGGNAPAPR
jgi:hypothetical protein